MVIKNTFALLLVVGIIASSGCYACLRNAGGYNCGGMCGPSCGCEEPICGCADECCPGCGCADAACGCADVACGCPEPACGCVDSCSGPVGCGTPVYGECLLGRLFGRLKICSRMRGCSGGCYGCADETYVNEWHSDPPCDCDACQSYGGPSAGYPRGRRGPSYASRGGLRRGENFSDAVENIASQPDSGPRMR